MSEEEKKAIERLIIYKDKIKDELYPIIDFEEEKAIGTQNNWFEDTNLIEKQSIEIEELKETLKCTQNSWYEDAKIIDKIKAKIEELEKQDKESRFSKNYLVIHVLQSLLEENK